jgi:hypothetical protein
MAQLPDSIRPYAEAVFKHHFWLLTLLVPLALLPLLWVATGSMDTKIGAQNNKIKAQIDALRKVSSRPDHPNESWTKAVETQLKAVRQETLAEWKRFWESQQSLRVWPDKFGPDFLRAVGALRPGSSLDRQFLQRYQNMVADVVRQLPGRMGAAEAMTETTGKSGGAASRPVAGSGSRFLVTWATDDQVRLYKSFKWDSTPSTVQVLLAQEELWLYGMLCDFIRRANEKATGAFDSTITDVEQLAVGFPAAEDRPGGQGGSRILVGKGGGSSETGGDGAAAPPGGAAATGREPASRPSHPRFGGAPAPRSGGAEAAATGGLGGGPASASPDDALREWIYVDFSGRPLSAAELASAPEAQMVHLMPFVLRVVMDERRLDSLLADIAAVPIPIDVRQVRVNADTGAAGPATAGSSGPRRRRPYDVTVEVRGTVALATVPDEKVLDTMQPSLPGTPSAGMASPHRREQWARRWRPMATGVMS